ncbi:MAG: hypothetical protein Q7U47_06425 [Paludibacter sp.]|nr:hypothetical protein [Paludibacter sp.]
MKLLQLNTTLVSGSAGRIAEEIGLTVMQAGGGSVVRGKIQNYAIVTGNPAKITGDIRDFADKIKSRNNIDFIIDTK